MDFLLFDQYQEETRRTAPQIDDVIGCLLNFSMGLSGESAEVLSMVDDYSFTGFIFDKNKIAKELGDLLWYTAREADALGIKFSSLSTYEMFDDFLASLSDGVTFTVMKYGFQKTLSHYSMKLSAFAGEITDHIKKVVFQGHNLDVELVSYNLKEILCLIGRLAFLLGFTLSRIAVMNVEKLRSRYPNGFSFEDSVNRTDRD